MTTKKKPKTGLSDMEYDEVSLVALAANQEADVVLFKSGNGPEPRGDGEIATHTTNDAQIALAKARMAIAKYNKNHSRTNGQFTSGSGGGGTKSAPSTGKKTMAQKQKEIDSLTPAQQRRYDSAPAKMTHDEAMAHAKGPGFPKKSSKIAPGRVKAEPKKLLGYKDIKRKITDKEEDDIENYVNAGLHKYVRSMPKAMKVGRGQWEHQHVKGKTFKTLAEANTAAYNAATAQLYDTAIRRIIGAK